MTKEEKITQEKLVLELEQSKQLANELFIDKTALREKLETAEDLITLYKNAEARLQGMDTKSNEIIKYLIMLGNEKSHQLGLAEKVEEE